MSIQAIDTCSQSDYFITNTKLMSLIYSSAIGERFKLSNSTLIVLFALCFHYNGNRNDSFPGQQLISSKTGLSISSIKRAIKELLQCGLILKSRNRYGNLYKFTQKFFDELNLTSEIAQNKSSKRFKKTPSCNEQTNNINLNKNNSFSIKLNHLMQFKYWKHKNTGQIYQIKPDIGTHLLIKIDMNNKQIFFNEHNLFDSIENFEGINQSIKDKTNNLTKFEIIQNLIETDNIQQANYLTKLWKINKSVDKNRKII
ncbi:MAG: helix-turn-helix domain-containing protein [Vampirovibrionia bacterium]